MAAAKWLVVCLLTAGFFLAVASVYLTENDDSNVGYVKRSLLSSSDSSDHILPKKHRVIAKVWPKLKFGWKIVFATIVGFVGSAFGTVGGVSGGGIFVPMLNLIVGFDPKSAAAISKCMTMGAAASSFCYNLRVPHPRREGASIIDYDLALLFLPMLMLGISIGVPLSVVFPYWLITILLIIFFMGTSSRSFVKAMGMWKKETISMKAIDAEQTVADSRGDQSVVDSGTEQQPAPTPKEKKTTLQTMKDNLDTKRVSVILLVWISFIILQVLKNKTKSCSSINWVLQFLQFPVALVVFCYQCITLYKGSKKHKMAGNSEQAGEATIEWTVTNLALCALCGLLGGTAGGLLGSGAGFILGPLLLEIGVIPQVASATATFVMMFSSSLSVVEFYLLKRFPIPYALYLMAVAILAGFWGQWAVRKVIKILKRASIIVFILSSVIFASALIMGIVGTLRSVRMIKAHEFMGFLDFCSGQ